MRAISIRQPWGWAILYAGKRVENRPKPCSYRGPVLLHASLGCTRLDFEGAVHSIAAMRTGQLSDLRTRVPDLERVGTAHASSSAIDCMPRGGLIGIARIVGCSEHAYAKTCGPYHQGWRILSDETEGPVYGLELADVEPLPFLPLKGALAVPFNVEPQLAALAARDPRNMNEHPTVTLYRAAWRRLGGT